MENQSHQEPAIDSDAVDVLPLLLPGLPAETGRQRCRHWPLVLSAREIPWQLDTAGDAWRLLVPAPQLAVALEQLELYERENRNWPPPLPQRPPLYDNQLPTLAGFALLAGFSLYAGVSRPDWKLLGSADASRILSGEWWRALTALTLHADWLHLAGNVVFGLLMVTRLARELGSGVAWLLVIACGTAGNLLNAWLQNSGYRSIGASTAVFAAVGLLAALNLVRYRKPLWKRWALPLAGAAGLLAMLGSGGEGSRTDLGGHLFGLISGLIGGLATSRLLLRHGRPSSWVNRVSGLLAGGLIVAAWYLALQGESGWRILG